MAISFHRLQEYLDLIVLKAHGDITAAPHNRFWNSYNSLTTLPLSRPKCQGQDIYAVKYLDAARSKVDADNSPLYLILVDAIGFCGREQMPPSGPFITDSNYSVTLSDGTVVTGANIVQDIHDWLASGAPNG